MVAWIRTKSSRLVSGAIVATFDLVWDVYKWTQRGPDVRVITRDRSVLAPLARLASWSTRAVERALRWGRDWYVWVDWHDFLSSSARGELRAQLSICAVLCLFGLRLYRGLPGNPRLHSRRGKRSRTGIGWSLLSSLVRPVERVIPATCISSGDPRLRVSCSCRVGIYS